MNIKPRQIPKWLILSGVPVLLACSCLWYVLVRLPWVTEYSQRPPEVIFQEVMGKPVPKGVSDLRVAARHYFIKRWVWMRFRAADETIQTLTDEQEPYDQPTAQRALQGKAWVGNHKYDEADMDAVGWQEVIRILKPEAYKLIRGGSSSGGFIWMGDIIVDRQNHTVYVHAGGD